MKNITISILFLITFCSVFSQNKFEKWQSPSYFRGYNILYETPKTQQDITDFRNYGGNLLQIGTWGFLGEDAPYNINQNNIDGTDLLVNFCRNAGVYYVIAVRSGPGAYDSYQETQGLTGESRIWNSGNTAEQNLYGDMLKIITDRYKEDTLFTGINVLVEPRPKAKLIPANTSSLYKIFLENVYNIHMDEVYNLFVNKIREVSTDIPIILENFAYSTPELFPPYEIFDSFILYSAHIYMPKEFTSASVPYSMTYPGIYWNITFLSQVLYDEQLLRETVFQKVRKFQISTGKPIILGEFGMLLPQNGGPQYISDVLNICTNYGWHFSLWDWRRGSGEEWNIEGFTGDDNAHWKTVLNKFHAPPVPVLLLPADSSIETLHPAFVWEELTPFTMFDLIIYSSGRNLYTANNINASTFIMTDDFLKKGIVYSWKVRAKNPFGNSENTSEWSAPKTFYIPVPDSPEKIKNQSTKLEGNYPNPFNPTTVISYSVGIPSGQLAVNSFVTLKIFDMLGREAATLVNEAKTAGTYKAEWNARQGGSSTVLSSGMYFYRLTVKTGASEEVFTKKMVLVK